MTRHAMLTMNFINVDSFITTLADPPPPFCLDWKGCMVVEKNASRSFDLVLIVFAIVADFFEVVVIEVEVRFDMVWF